MILTPDTGTFRLALLSLIISAYGCKPASTPSDYMLETEVCVQTSPTCEAYVECMVSVGKRYGIQYHGKCL